MRRPTGRQFNPMDVDNSYFVLHARRKTIHDSDDTLTAARRAFKRRRISPLMEVGLRLIRRRLAILSEC